MESTLDTSTLNYSTVDKSTLNQHSTHLSMLMRGANATLAWQMGYSTGRMGFAARGSSRAGQMHASGADECSRAGQMDTMNAHGRGELTRER